MKKFIASLTAVSMLMFSITSCASPNSQDRAATENKFGLLEDGVINVATSPDYPPFEFLEGDTITGFDIELLNSVAKLSDLEVKFSPLEFESIITAVQAGQFDMGMSSFTETEERKKSVLFGDTYYYSAQVALVSADSSYTTLDELKGKKLGAGMGTTGETAAKTLSEDVELIATSVGFPMLAGGQLDAYVCDIGVATNAVATGKYKMIEAPISEEKTAMVFKLGNTALQEELNKSLAEFMKSEEYTALLEKYNLN